MSIQLLNFDTSLPDADTYRDTNTAATLRFLTSADGNSILSMNRIFGDLTHRLLKDETKLNEVIIFLNSNPALQTFDNTPYVLTDGSHAFLAPISGVTPTAAAHLTTKNYVDTAIAAQGAAIQQNSDDIAALEAGLPFYRTSAWVEHVWNGAVKETKDLNLTTAVVDRDKVVSINLLEKLNVGTLLSPVWVYRQLMHGTSVDGFKIDDYWLRTASVVQVLIPNTTSFPQDYPVGANYNLVAVVQRYLKAVVVEMQ